METIKYLIIDTETTGLDASKHEMLAFGAVVVVDGRIVETLELKIKPARIENADKKALEVNGYTERAWRDATPILLHVAPIFGRCPMPRCYMADAVIHKVKFGLNPEHILMHFLQGQPRGCQGIHLDLCQVGWPRLHGSPRLQGEHSVQGHS